MKHTLYIKDLPDDIFDQLKSSIIIAVDIETTGLNLFRDEVCTVQLSNGNVNLIIKIDPNWIPENLKLLLENEYVLKVFHHAPFDVSMLYQSMGINTRNFQCLKVLSKIIRTYTDQHRLKDLAQEMLGHKMDKSSQQSCWFVNELSTEQQKYAVRDVADIIEIYKKLHDMIELRGRLRSGFLCSEVHKNAQEAMRNMIPLLVSGYGSPDNNWDLGWLFKH